MAGEGVVDQHFRAPLLGGLDDLRAAVDFINTHDNIRGGCDGLGILSGHAGHQENIITLHLGLDLGEGGSRSLNGLHHDDGLDLRISREGQNLADGGFYFGGKLVRIGIGHDDIGILFLKLLRGAVFFLALGGGACDDGDLIGLLGSHRRDHHGQGENHREQQDKGLLHAWFSPFYHSAGYLNAVPRPIEVFYMNLHPCQYRYCMF